MPKSDVIVSLLQNINDTLEGGALSGGGGLSNPGTPNTLVVVDADGTSLKSTSTTLASLQTAITQYSSLSYLNSSKTTLQNIISRWSTYGGWSNFDISPYISKGGTNMKYKNYDGNQMIKSNGITTELYSPNGEDKIMNIKDGEFKIAYPGQGKSPESYALTLGKPGEELQIKPYGKNQPCLTITNSRLKLSAPDVDDYPYCGISLYYNGGSSDSESGLKLMYNDDAVFRADSNQTQLKFNEQTVFRADSNRTQIKFQEQNLLEGTDSYLTLNPVWDGSYLRFYNNEYESSDGLDSFEIYLNGNEVLRIQEDSTKSSYIYNFAGGNTSLETRENELILHNGGYKVMLWYDGLDTSISNGECPFQLLTPNGHLMITSDQGEYQGTKTLRLYYPYTEKEAISIKDVRFENDIYHQHLDLKGDFITIQIGETELTLNETKLQKLKALLEE